MRKEEKEKANEKRKIYTHLITEFQRIARRDEKVFVNDQCKEIEENNKMGKARDLFKKSKRYQGNISYKDGLNKGHKLYGPNKAESQQTGKF